MQRSRIVVKDIRHLYKTAFSPLYEVFVAITHVHTDADGKFIFTCDFSHKGAMVKGILFREHELERFCL
jgi:hypothetical protein